MSAQNQYNCHFYSKIGACRHGEACTRIHNRPNYSHTVLLVNLYQNPNFKTLVQKGQIIEKAPKFSDVEEQMHFDQFFEEVYMEIEEEYGHIQEMNVCQNLGKHLNGNVYIKFYKQKHADKAVFSLNNRWFDQRTINAELSPVEDFQFACCPEFDMGECERGHFCNFLHLKPISKELRQKLTSRPISKRNGRKRKRRDSNKSHKSLNHSSSSGSTHKRSSSSYSRSRSSNGSHRSSSGSSRSRSTSRSIPKECLRS